jgi:AcrR family transcriptional regulator
VPPRSAASEIARIAGAGTLYRHFPTGDALVAAVYRNEIEQLVQPPPASRRHILRCRRSVNGCCGSWTTSPPNTGCTEVLNSIAGGTSDLYSASTAQVKQAIAKLVDRAVASGDIRLDFDPLDLLRALAGCCEHRLGTRW